MKTKQFFWNDQKAVPTLLQQFICDRLSIVSTDTIFGFLGRCSSVSYSALNTIKGERSNKPYLILVGNIEALDVFVDTSVLPDYFLGFLRKVWPNPVTIVFKARAGIAPYMTSDSGTIAIRMPNHEGLLRLLQYEKGLFSTSANKSGCTPPQNYEELDSRVLDEIDVVVLDKHEADPQTKPSTIIDCSNVQDTGQVLVVREGAFPIKELEGFYGDKFIK